MQNDAVLGLEGAFAVSENQSFVWFEKQMGYKFTCLGQFLQPAKSI